MNPTTCEPVLAACAATSNEEDAPQIMRVRIGDLRAHPRQGELFPDLPPSEFAALVDDLRQNGQREPIRIRSDRTILVRPSARPGGTRARLGLCPSDRGGLRQ